MKQGEFLAEKALNLRKWLTSEIDDACTERFQLLQITPVTATTIGCMLAEIKDKIDERNWSALIEHADLPAEWRECIVLVQARVDLHDKWWRYMDLFCEVCS